MEPSCQFWENPMIEVLIRYFRKGTRPFRSLSSLPEAQAISIMEALYVPGSILWQRFRDPKAYLDLRREVERQLFTDFKAKGGDPKNDCPIYFVVGLPKWAVHAVDSVTMATTDEIRIPASTIDEREISFTFPDSMLSVMMKQRGEAILPDSPYGGQALTLREMELLIEDNGLPVAGWEPDLPPHLNHYIEAQVWDDAVLQEYLRTDPVDT